MQTLGYLQSLLEDYDKDCGIKFCAFHNDKEVVFQVDDICITGGKGRQTTVFLQCGEEKEE